MGSVQVGNVQGQEDETQRNLRRQLGVERSFRYTLLFCVCVCKVLEDFATVFPVLCSAICFVRFYTYVWLKVDSGGDNELEQGKHFPLVPVSHRTGHGVAELLSSAKRGCPRRCIPKGTPHCDLRPTWVHPEVPTFVQRPSTSRRMHSR